MKNTNVRHPTLKDVPILVELEKKVWGEEMAADEDKWISRINIFPEGICLVEENQELVGVMVTLIVNWDDEASDYPTWEEVSGNGYLSMHNKNGNTLYGIDVTVLPKSPGVAQQLVDIAVNDIKLRNLKRGVVGSRIPTLRRYVEENNLSNLNQAQVEKYCVKDLTVRFFKHNGFKLLAAKKDYFVVDQDSLGWGAIMEIV